jgi:2-dehydropantoate 2-reductase
MEADRMELKPKPRIAVVGAGAIGSLIGGLLARAGEDVTLIARTAHVQAIRQHGLIIEGVLGSLTIPVQAAEQLDFDPDLVLLAVKTQDVESSCRDMQARIQRALLLTLQNGVRSDNLVAGFMPRENILSGVVMFNGQYLVPGRITYAHPGSLVIGDAFGNNGRRARNLQVLLNHAVRTTVSDDIQGVHWTKLLVNNLGNGLEAMTGMNIRFCMAQSGLRSIGLRTLKEGSQVIAAAGYHLAPLPGVPAYALEVIIRSPLPIGGQFLRLSMGSLKTVSSTLQSLRRGRSTEIDYLNGEIVRLGEKLGLATPCNSLVVQIVKEVERTGRFGTTEELKLRFSFR